jgi:hypothetical protein
MLRLVLVIIIQSTNTDHLHIILHNKPPKTREKGKEGVCGGYQDFEDTVDGRAAVSAKVVSDVLAAGALLVETLGLTLGELDRARGEHKIRRKRTTRFLLARLAMANSLSHINPRPKPRRLP